jgi:hypothetical protein
MQIWIYVIDIDLSLAAPEQTFTQNMEKNRIKEIGNNGH